MPTIAASETAGAVTIAVPAMPTTSLPYAAIANINAVASVATNPATTAPTTITAATALGNSTALQQRLQPDAGYTGYTSVHTSSTSAASMLLSNFLPTAALSSVSSAYYSSIGGGTTTATTLQPNSSSGSNSSSSSSSTSSSSSSTPAFATHSPPSIANLVASSAEDLSNFRDVTFDIFDDDDDLFGSPLAFDASENGLWNGRFVPPPPRPPFLVDDAAVLSDGLTTCDLCSWAMPTKSTFIFEGTIEKASELGWPLTLIIVSILSALIGAVIMVTVVRCRRKKASNNRNETHVQWWSRNKRPASNNNNHLRRSNIYTAHPADSIRGLQQPSLSAASSLTAITAMVGGGGGGTTSGSTLGTLSHLQQHLHEQEPHSRLHQHSHHSHRAHATLGHHLHHHHLHHRQHHHHPHPQQLFQQHDYDDYEHEYHQPQELHLHQRQHSSSLSSSSTTSSPSPSLTATTMMPVVQQMHQPQQHNQQYLRDEALDAPPGAGIVAVAAASCHWPNPTMLLAS